MAGNNIKFTIGTDYNGEGFKRAQIAVADLNKSTRAGAAVINQMAGAFSGLDGKAAQAVGAVTGMINAFLNLNPVMIGITAAISALSWALKELEKREQAAKAAAEEHRQAMEKLLSKVNTGCFNAAIEEARRLGEEYDRITKHANDMNAAINALVNQKASGGVLQLQADKIVAVFNEVTDEGKKLVEAEYNLKIATAEAASIREQAFMQLESAEKAVADKEGEIANLVEQRAAMEKQLITMKENNASVELMEKSKREEILKQISDLQAKMGEVDVKIIAAKEKLEVLHVNEQTAIEKRNAAETAATMKVTEAEQKQFELVDALEKRKLAEEAAAEIAKNTEEQARLEIEAREEQRMREQEEAEALKQLTEARKNAATEQKNINDAAKALANAEIAYTKKLQEYNAFDLIAEAAKNMIKNGGGLAPGKNLLPVDVQKGIMLQTADTKVNDAIRNGAINTVKDADRLQRQAMREARDAISKNQGQQLREAQRYKRLQEMNPKALCSSDKEFMAKYEKIQAAAEQRKKDLADAKKAVEEEKKAVIESKKKLEDIDKRLANLGLK